VKKQYVGFELMRVMISDCDGDHQIVLKELDGNRQLPIAIGTFEALAIHSKVHDVIPPRPMTHDLIANILEAGEWDLKELLIDNFAVNQDGQTGTFHGKLLMKNSRGEKEIDCRPSDGIAIAVRLGIPICVHESVLEAQAV
jgi:bifunctional DNase/RNase